MEREQEEMNQIEREEEVDDINNAVEDKKIKSEKIRYKNADEIY